jgi:hypothetical protein
LLLCADCIHGKYHSILASLPSKLTGLSSERYTSFGFTRIRQLQRAYRENDRETFKAIQSSFYEESKNFTEVAQDLYKSRTNDPVCFKDRKSHPHGILLIFNKNQTSEEYYTQPVVEAYRSYYPELNGIYTVNISLFDHMMVCLLLIFIKWTWKNCPKLTRIQQNFATAGLSISNVSFDHFSNSERNNDVRYSK